VTTEGGSQSSSRAKGRTIDLRPLFAPRSVAIVGASGRSGSIAETMRSNLRATGSATRCHFINPRYDELLGQPCYPSIAALPERPDAVLIAINAARAASVTEEAAAAGVPVVVIPGGGVVEGGEPAAEMQRRVAAIARDSGIALVGPNCMGVWDLTTNASIYIGDVNPWLPRGGVAGIAQSGSVADAFIHSGSRIGFSRIVSCGSEVALDVCDYLAYCLDDAETSSVIMFIEGLKRPEKFLALADHALAIGKPLMVVKVGRSQQAQAAAVAHSGSLAGETRVTEAALDAAGVIRCRDLDELFEAAELAEGCRRTGRAVARGRTGVVTVSTGEASLVADLASTTGIDLPPIPGPAREAILSDLPTMTYLGNPIDPWGADEAPVAYAAVFEALAASGAYDVLAIVHDFPYRSLPSEVQVAEDVTRALLRATASRPEILPVYVSLTSGEHPPETRAVLAEAHSPPMLRGAGEAFTAVARRAAWEGRRDRRAASEPRRPAWPALAEDRTSLAYDANRADPPSSRASLVLSEAASLRLLAAEGLPMTPLATATDSRSAVAAAAALGFPVALKLDAVGVAHKSDVAGVRLGLTSAQAVADAARELLALRPPNASVTGLVVQPMAPPGVELIVGLRRDPQFGPAVVLGIGGVIAEALDDVTVLLAPLDVDEALAALDALRAAPLLRGFRGRPAADLGAVAALAVALGDFGWRHPDILEVDLNPVISSARATLAVDALVVRAG
jgi:acetate---CoA ligase (ADP-forming)